MSFEQIKTGVTAICRFLVILLVYNFTILFGLAFGGAIGIGTILIIDQIFQKGNSSNAILIEFLGFLSNLLNWALLHPGISITVLLVAYIVGFFAYICGFAGHVRNNILGQ